MLRGIIVIISLLPSAWTCFASASTSSIAEMAPTTEPMRLGVSSSPALADIKTFVVVMLENRSFDNVSVASLRQTLLRSSLISGCLVCPGVFPQSNAGRLQFLPFRACPAMACCRFASVPLDSA